MTGRSRDELIADCVHCGFCLPTCPTYQLWGEEMDSPRGRIYLMDLASKGEIELAGAGAYRDVPGAALMRAVRDQFDPDRRMFPGRFTFAGGE